MSDSALVADAERRSAGAQPTESLFVNTPSIDYAGLARSRTAPTIDKSLAMYVAAEELIKSEAIGRSDLREMLETGLIGNVFYRYTNGEFVRIESYAQGLLAVRKDETTRNEDFWKSEKSFLREYWAKTKCEVKAIRAI